jgi:hypothetical protein
VLGAGSQLEVRPQDLKIQFLDYLAWGGGGLALKVERGGESPDLRLDAALSNAQLKRQGEKDAVVEQVNMDLSGSLSGIDLKGGGKLTGIDLRIPSAKVTDMTAYNAMLPPNVPLKLLAGQADLTADVRLKPEFAAGSLKLRTTGLSSQLDEQKVAGDLTLDVELRGGNPEDMAFDITGSTLSLEGFRVAGEQQTYSEKDWRAQIKLRRGKAVWRKPVKLDVEAEIGMKDSRPIVALMSNQRGKHGWLGKILTVEDIKGSADLQVCRRFSFHEQDRSGFCCQPGSLCINLFDGELIMVARQHKVFSLNVDLVLSVRRTIAHVESLRPYFVILTCRLNRYPSRHDTARSSRKPFQPKER